MDDQNGQKMATIDYNRLPDYFPGTCRCSLTRPSLSPHDPLFTAVCRWVADGLPSPFPFIQLFLVRSFSPRRLGDLERPWGVGRREASRRIEDFFLYAFKSGSSPESVGLDDACWPLTADSPSPKTPTDSDREALFFGAGISVLSTFQRGSTAAILVCLYLSFWFTVTALPTLSLDSPRIDLLVFAFVWLAVALMGLSATIYGNKARSFS
jgi:hypothetical protein